MCRGTQLAAAASAREILRMVVDTTVYGRQLSGPRAVEKQRTVNPLIALCK
jgi:hypothetical protein